MGHWLWAQNVGKTRAPPDFAFIYKFAVKRLQSCELPET
jgi:hypothetical protein